DAESDGIIQFSIGGAEFGSGLNVKNMVAGAEALAAFTHEAAKHYGVNVALHTDHCQEENLDTFVLRRLLCPRKPVAAGANPLFQSHMWDGSATPVDETLQIAKDLLDKSVAANIIL